MSAEDFFDSSIMVYAISHGDARTDLARELVRQGGTISVQVLNETVSVARRKLRYEWEEIEEAIDLILGLCSDPWPITFATHEAGIRIAQRYGYHIYDSMIVASALEAGCTTLYSEDMQDGQTIGPLTIRNPFRM
jgi:predicted nucleic acid-binding protein